MAKRQDIVYGDVFAGETIVLRYRVKDAEREVVDITNWTTRTVLALSEGGSAVYSVAGTVTDALAGIWQATIPRGTLLAYAGEEVWYGGWRADPTEEALLAYGMLRISPAPQLPA